MKPENILVEDFNIDDEPYVKLTDVGYATVFKIDQETMGDNTSLGTLSFMAPELV